MKSNDEAQSEAPSVARLLDWIYDDENGVSHCCGQRGTGEGSRPELKAKINRLITEARLNELQKVAIEVGFPEKQRSKYVKQVYLKISYLKNRFAELSNNLSKGDGDG